MKRLTGFALCLSILFATDSRRPLLAAQETTWTASNPPAFIFPPDQASLPLYRAKVAEANGYCRQASVNFLARRYEPALENFNRALGIFGSLKGSEQSQGMVLKQMALILAELRRYPDAIASNELAASLFESTNRPKDQADCIANLSSELVRLGRYEEAIASNREALRLFRSASYFHVDQIGCMANLGGALMDAGRYAEAIDTLETVRSITGQKLPSQNSKDRAAAGLRKGFASALLDGAQEAAGQEVKAFCLFQLGRVLDLTGRYQQALERFKEAHELAKTIPFKEKLQALCLINQGWALIEMERYKEAGEPLRKAHEICVSIKDKEHEALSLMDLGMVFHGLDQEQEALEQFQASLSIYDSLSETQGPKAVCLVNVSNTFAMLGRFDDAVQTLRDAAAVFEETTGTKSELLDCTWNLGYYLPALKQRAAALEELTRTSIGSWEYLIANFPGMDESAKKVFLKEKFRDPDLLYTLVLHYADSATTRAQAGLEAALMNKAIVEQAVQIEQTVLKKYSPDEWAKEHESLQRLKDEKRALLDAASATTQTIARRHARLMEIERSINSLEEERARKNLAYAQAMRPKRVCLSDVAGALRARGNDTALVEIIKYTRRDFDTTVPADYGKKAEGRYAAFVLRSGDELPQMVDLGTTEPIEKLLGAYREALGMTTATLAYAGATQLERRKTQQENSAELSGYTSQLRKLVLDPLEKPLGSAKRVFFAGDGELKDLPFEELAAGGKPRHFIPLTSGRELAHK